VNSPVNRNIGNYKVTKDKQAGQGEMALPIMCVGMANWGSPQVYDQAE